MTVASDAIETPSGKDAAGENFPVGSWLLPASLRPHIATFYRFARAIDDIADNPDLAAEVKIRRLQAFEDALLGPGGDDPALETAFRMRASLKRTGVAPRHCQDLIAAFKRDATKLRYDDWDDLMGYCILSASPVGRYLIDLHGGARHGYGPSDALCNALQVLNHLQDCQDDYRALNRVYLPQDWMVAEGATVEDLDQDAAMPALRRVLDRCLDNTAALLAEARLLPGGIVNRRLAMESSMIVTIAERLTGLLRRGDPLAGRVALSKPAYLWCGVRGVARVALGRR